MLGKKAIIGLLLILACQSCTTINDSNQGTHKDNHGAMTQSKITTDTRNVMNAIDLAIQAVQKESLLHGTEYVLMAVQQIPIKNKWIWRVTFKPKHLVSDDPSKGPLGLGGEAFVNVDLSTKETTVTYGE